MNQCFSIINGQDINNFINENYIQIFKQVREAYLSYHTGKAINPLSSFLKYSENDSNRIIALPATIFDQKKVSGVKWISSYPNNKEKYNLPRASAVIILNDYETGLPIACLEGSIISAVRTACSAVLAAEKLNSKNSRQINRLGFIGNGFIAENILLCFERCQWNIEEINLYDTQQQSSKNFINKFIDYKFNVFEHKEQIIQQSDVIVLATTANKPHIHDSSLFKHLPIVLHVSLRDLSSNIILESNNITDNLEQVLSHNTSLDLAYQQYQHKDFINGTIIDLINETITLPKYKTNIFSPMGMGLLDIAVANFIFNNIEKNKKLNINNFFLS